MGIKAVVFALLCAPVFASAQGYICAGSDPDWLLNLNDVDARFDFDNRVGGFQVLLQTPAENRDWPKAFTLISSVDTAIVLLDQRQCGIDDFSAQVLTQRGITAILLTGCCMQTAP